jgi:hypothetical protein
MAAESPLPDLFSELLLSASGGDPDHTNGGAHGALGASLGGGSGGGVKDCEAVHTPSTAGRGGAQGGVGWGTDRPGGPAANPGANRQMAGEVQRVAPMSSIRSGRGDSGDSSVHAPAGGVPPPPEMNTINTSVRVSSAAASSSSSSSSSPSSSSPAAAAAAAAASSSARISAHNAAVRADLHDNNSNGDGDEAADIAAGRDGSDAGLGDDPDKDVGVSDGELASVLELSFAFRRATSRLTEMGSREYLQQHEAARRQSAVA